MAETRDFDPQEFVDALAPLAEGRGSMDEIARIMTKAMIYLKLESLHEGWLLQQRTARWDKSCWSPQHGWTSNHWYFESAEAAVRSYLEHELRKQ